MRNLKRDEYLKKINPYIGKQLIKVITGQRRVGKSYLLKQVIGQISLKNPKANIIYIDLEKSEFSGIRNHSQLEEYVSLKKKKKDNFLFIDEIQEIKGFENVFRGLVSDPAFDIYCTGSNAKMLSGELATYLSGRQIEIKVHSLSYPEFLKFHKKTASPSALNLFLRFGGMPYLINLQDDGAIKNEYLKNIFNTIMFRDIVYHYDVRDIPFLENLIRFIADNTGSLLSANNISKYLKSLQVEKSVQSVITYIEYITSSFAVNKARRIDVHGKKIFESGEKFYFEDLGIRNSIAGYNISEINKLIENAVYNHLVFCGYQVFVGKLGDTEIDFVAEKSGERIYIQAAYLLHDDKTISREFGNLLKVNDNFPKYVISADTFAAPNTYKGINHLTLQEFLQRPF